MPFLNDEQLKNLGLRSYGTNVLISDKASIYNAKNIIIGNNVRIDDFCILSAGVGNITIGSYVHIACYTSLIGKGSIIMEDFSVLSSKVAVYSSTDDFSGEFMVSPMCDSNHSKVKSKTVYIGKHTVVGTGSVILPGACIREGVALGAMTLLKTDTKEYSIYVGNPARYLRQRHDGCKRLSESYE
jgi:acetyltransferase-like isoleucine patch superfamily enzyme